MIHRLSAQVRATLAAVCLVSASPALAQKHVAKVANQEIQLVLPDNHCALDRREPSDARVIDLVERLLAGRNELHLTTVNCDELRAWRGSRKTLKEYTQVQSLVALKDRDLTGQERTAIGEICAASRQDGGSLTARADSDIQKRIDAGREKIKLEAEHFLGVVGEDEYGCYVAMLIRGTTENGMPKALLCVYANVIVKGKLLYLYRYSDDVGLRTVQRLLDDRKAAAKAHVEANGGSGRRM
jgi:hypothetical protein